MKTQIQKILIVLAIALSVNSKAQTTVDINNLIDSSLTSSHCPPPILVEIQAIGIVTGYNPAIDSISLHYFWDDGTDTVFKVGIVNAAPDYFWSNGIPHNYVSAGIYDVMVTATGPDGTADTIINSPITIYSGCALIDGYCYYDNNSNCVFDAADDTLAGVPIMIYDAGGAYIGYAYTNTSGYYSTYVPTGLTGLEILPILYWSSVYSTTVCPLSGSYTFNSTGAMSFNFGLDCTMSGADLFVYQAWTRVAPPGSEGWLSFWAGNASCTSAPSTITVTLDPNVTYVGMNSGPLPSSVAGNILTWNMTMPASYYFYGGFSANIKINTNTSAILLDPACFTVDISPTASDINILNNTTNFCRIIGGPYDPNNKEVSPAGIGATGDIAPNTELTYTVNFQNTGTAPAINVYVMDTISNNLDMSTFQIVASSHAMNPYFYDGNIIRFDYPNIMLPDSNANEALSHGWVVYKIKTKSGLTNGTQIKNTGHIFFDYNSAIVTNTTLNTINTALSVSENHNELSTLIYPNPAQNQFTVEFGEEVSGLLSVVDISGRVVKTISINKTNSVFVNTDDFSSGLYGLMMPGVKLKQNRVQIIK